MKGMIGSSGTVSTPSAQGDLLGQVILCRIGAGVRLDGPASSAASATTSRVTGRRPASPAADHQSRPAVERPRPTGRRRRGGSRTRRSASRPAATDAPHNGHAVGEGAGVSTLCAQVVLTRLAPAQRDDRRSAASHGVAEQHGDGGGSDATDARGDPRPRPPRRHSSTSGSSLPPFVRRPRADDHRTRRDHVGRGRCRRCPPPRRGCRPSGCTAAEVGDAGVHDGHGGVRVGPLQDEQVGERAADVEAPRRRSRRAAPRSARRSGRAAPGCPPACTASGASTPMTSLPRLTGWSPSTSLSGSTASSVAS